LSRLRYIANAGLAFCLVAGSGSHATASNPVRRVSMCELSFDPGILSDADAAAVAELLRWISLIHPAFEAAVHETRGEENFARLLALASAYTFTPPAPRGDRPGSPVRQGVQSLRGLPKDSSTIEDKEFDLVRADAPEAADLRDPIARRVVRNLDALRETLAVMGFSLDQRPGRFELQRGVSVVNVRLTTTVQVHALHQLNELLAGLKNTKVSRLVGDFVASHLSHILQIHDIYAEDDVWRDARAGARRHRDHLRVMGETIDRFAAELSSALPPTATPDFIPAVRVVAPLPTATDVTTLDQVKDSYRELLRQGFKALDEVTLWQRQVLEAKTPVVDWKTIHATRAHDGAWARAFASGVERARAGHLEHLALVEEAEAAFAKLRLWADQWNAHFHDATGGNARRGTMTATEAEGHRAAKSFFERFTETLDHSIAAMAIKGQLEHESLGQLGDLALLGVESSNGRLDNTLEDFEPNFVDMLQKMAEEQTQ
jgi:hypothetical protein